MTRNPYVLAALLIVLSVVSCKKDESDFVKNIAPLAEAGPAKNVVLPDSAVVTGAGTDADGKIVAYFWSQISGPTNSTIVNPGAASTVIKFNIPGSYVFQLMVTDDNGTPGVDTVAIAVSGSNPVPNTNVNGNKAPIADAGPSKIVSTNSVAVLSGSGTDVDGKIVAYLWSQVSGPGTPTIDNPGSATTNLHWGVPGTYVFQLMVVDDKGAVGVDTATWVANAVTITTLTLQPTNNSNEVNLAIEDGVDMSAVAGYDLPVQAWMRNAKQFIVRSLIKFDLSSIPVNAVINKAELYLYSYPSPTVSGNGVNANYGTGNDMYIQQVTSNWSPGTVKWSNQPTVGSTVNLGWMDPLNTNSDLVVDLAPQVKNMVNNNANYGFMLRLLSESSFNNSRIFVSSHNPNSGLAAKFPKLVVEYR